VSRCDRGMVTAELALAVPVVVMVLALGLAAIRVGVDQVRCVDAARLAARALARGTPRGRLVRSPRPPGHRVPWWSSARLVRRCRLP